MAPYLGPRPPGIPEFPPPRRMAGPAWAAVVLLSAVGFLGALAAIAGPAPQMAALCDPWK